MSNKQHGIIVEHGRREGDSKYSMMKSDTSAVQEWKEHVRITKKKTLNGKKEQSKRKDTHETNQFQEWSIGSVEQIPLGGQLGQRELD